MKSKKRGKCPNCCPDAEGKPNYFHREWTGKERNDGSWIYDWVCNNCGWSKPAGRPHRKISEPTRFQREAADWFREKTLARYPNHTWDEKFDPELEYLEVSWDQGTILGESGLIWIGKRGKIRHLSRYHAGRHYDEKAWEAYERKLKQEAKAYLKELMEN
jgi:hypothetical protein